MAVAMASMASSELAVHSVSPNPAPRAASVEFTVEFTGVEEKHLSECK